MSKRISLEEAKERSHRIHGDEYEIRSVFVEKNTSRVRVFHKLCCKEFVSPVSSFLSLKRPRNCPHCYGTRLKTTEEFKDELKNMVGDEYELIGEYKGTNHKNLFKHKTCGKLFEMKPNIFITNHARCPHCFGCFRKTTEKFKNDVHNIVGDEYTVLGEYKNNKEKIEFRHNKCGKKFSMTPNHFLSSSNRCPFCAHSKNEQEIFDYLTQKNVTFKHDKRLTIYSKRERFDFQIFVDNKLRGIIEYDGEFHYFPIFGEERLKIQKERDARKNKFCKEKNIPILRIPYWDHDKKYILIDNFLNDILIPSTTISNESKGEISALK